jgi:hypothetical protein
MRRTYIALVFLPVLIGIGYVALVDTKPISVSQTPIKNSPVKIEASELLCFNETTKSLRTSETTTGCSLWETSLGYGVIQKPTSYATALIPELRARFLAAQAAAKLDGFTLTAISGFRSYDHQRDLFNAAIKKYGSESEASKWVLPPDISHHPWGLAIDVNYPYDPASTKWLEKNGYIYGLCRAYENEWWHFEGLTNPGSPCPEMLKDASLTDAS